MTKSSPPKKDEYVLAPKSIRLIVNPDGSRAYDMDLAREIESELDQFFGSLYWYSYGNFLFTDGVYYLVDKCDATWLLLAVLFAQDREEVKHEVFQVWKYQPNQSDLGGVLSCEDGNSNEVYRREFKQTSFPLPNGIKLYFSNDVLYLPSEH